MHPNSMKRKKTLVWGPMGWIGCVRCETFWRGFVARTFALVRPVFHRVLRANQMVPNASIYYETRQNMCLGSKGVDRVRLLRKIMKWLRDTNFCTSLAGFGSSFSRQPNGPKCTKILRNTPKHEFRVQWGGSGAFVAKNYDATSWYDLLH